MTLRVKVSTRAALQVRRAAEWWLENRPSAPGATAKDSGETIALLAEQLQKGRLRCAGAAALCVVLVACGGGDDSRAATPVSFSVLDTYPFSGVHVPRYSVAKTQAEWAALWSEHKPNSPSSPPPVDFSQQMVVGVFLGQRASGCHSVTISGVSVSAIEVTVRYTEATPDPGVSCLAVVVYPSQIASIPASNLPVSFVAMK